MVGASAQPRRAGDAVPAGAGSLRGVGSTGTGVVAGSRSTGIRSRHVLEDAHDGSEVHMNALSVGVAVPIAHGSGR